MLSFIDRQILSLLVEPMKRDLALTDVQVSLLQGLAFAVIYCVAGLPLGRAADQFNRRNIILIGVAFWSVMTSLWDRSNLCRSVPLSNRRRRG